MFSIESMDRCYHMYWWVLEASVSEELTCPKERGNLVDPFAVAVLKNGDVVGHILRKISSICCTFLRNGPITCRVIGSPRYSADLPQGGMEVSCVLIFRGDLQRMDKARRLLQFTTGLKKQCNAITVKRQNDYKAPRVNLAITREIFE